MDDCPFCKISRREIQVMAVDTNDGALAFLDINPVAPGHTLVIPKKHAATLLDMDDEAVKSLFSLVKGVAGKIKAGLECDGFSIGINHGQAAGQAVPHVHVHVIPRFKDDKGGSMHSIVMNKPKEGLDAVFRKITRAEPPVKAEEETREEPVQAEKKEKKDEKKIFKDWELEM